ncbi:acetylornithine deacetylase [Rhodobacterales bacterium]|nr:acetylornithine deacetylase [Rhodobacterales bacterium]
MTNAYALLDKLVSFPTVSRNGNIDLIGWVHDLLQQEGIRSRLLPSDSGDRANLFATIGPDGPGGVVLSGHTDVVPTDGQNWTSDAFSLQERNGLFYGRGTADMKGFVACAIETFLQAARKPLNAPLHLALSYDEEIGCVGVRPMLDDLKRAGLKPAWVLVGEPTSMRVATGHKGKLAARATCCGHAVHSALAPTGLNALHMAADFLSEIRALQNETSQTGPRDTDFDIPYTTLHAGIMQGGTALNIVPDVCTLDFEIRNVAAQDARSLLERLFETASRQETVLKDQFPDASIRIDVLNAYPSLETPSDSPQVAQARAISGSNAPLKVAFGTEGGLFRQHFDVPVVICGPGSMDQGHKPDEFIARDQMELCRRMLARLVDTQAA